MSDNYAPAQRALAEADRLDRVVSDYRETGNHERAGRVIQHQRGLVKRAEVHALMAIADELSRIGLTR